MVVSLLPVGYTLSLSSVAVALSVSSVAPRIIPRALMQGNYLYMCLPPTFDNKLL